MPNVDPGYNKNTPYTKLSTNEKNKIANVMSSLASSKKSTPTPKPRPTRVGSLAKPTAKPKPSASPTLPTLAEFKQSAAYKTGAMTYKEYIDYFKSQGATR